MLRTTAVLLSLPLPGLGHALAGRMPRALLIATISLAAQALFALLQTATPVTPTHLHLAALWMVLALAATLATAADAWRVARTAAPLRDRGGWRRLTLGLAAVLALNTGLAILPLAPVTWRSFYAPSGSMLPTLRPGDRFIVQDGWYDTNPVQRGEIVVFTLAPNPEAYVKRVIAIAGDRIRMDRGTLVLNGTALPSTAAGNDEHTLTLPNGASYTVLKRTNQGSANTTAEFLVPDGHIFVLGDNLDDSYDSRLNPRMRYIPTTNLIGRAAIIYWPFTGARFGVPLR